MYWHISDLNTFGTSDDALRRPQIQVSFPMHTLATSVSSTLEAHVPSRFQTRVYKRWDLGGPGFKVSAQFSPTPFQPPFRMPLPLP